MKTLSAALEAAQKANSGVPYIEALVDDYWGYAARARPQRLYSGAEATDPVAACMAPDGSLIRLRRLTQAATLERTVAASSDDAFENAGAVSLTLDGASANIDDTDEYGGYRFLNVTVPQGATILRARLLIVVAFSGGDDPKGTLFGNDVDNAPTFTTAANNVSGRAQTTAQVAVDKTGLPFDGTTYVELGVITSIVQEIVDRGGWASGNALALIYQGSADNPRDLNAVQWDEDPEHAPRLEITYATGSPQATAYASRVTTPAPGDTWSSWTSIDAEISALGDVCLAVDEDTLYAFMVDDDLTTIVMRTSANNGASWGNRSTVTSAGGVKTKLCAAAADDGDIVLFYAEEGGTVYSIRWNGSSWGSPAAWSNSLEVVDGLACCYVADWQVVVTGREDATADPGVWSCYFGDGGQFTVNTWGALRDVVTSAFGSEILYTEPSVARTDVFRLYFTERFGGDEAYAKVHWTTLDDSKSFNEDQWREPQVFDYEGDGVAVTVSGSELWLVASNGVWLSELPAYDQVDIAAAIVEASVKVDDRGAVAEVELDNAGGDWTSYGSGTLGALQRGARLQLTPGYRTSAGGETPGGTANTYWVESLELVTGSRPVLRIRARDGWWLLSRWRARRQFGWAAGDLAVSQLLMRIAGRGGMGYTGGGTVSDLLTSLQPAFTVQPGETGEGAARRLLRFVEDVGYWDGEFLNVRLPEDDESATYAFGPGEHAVLEARYPDAGAAVNRARVVGTPGVYAEETDFSESERIEQIGVALDLNLTTGEEAAAHAAAVLRKSYLEASVAEIKLPGVHCGVQLYDVVTLTDPQAGLDAAPRRVIGYAWRFDSRRGRYEMILTLGNV